MHIQSNESLIVRGTFDSTAGTLTLKDGQVARAKLTQEDNGVYPISLMDLRRAAAITSFLPTAGDGTNLGLVTGTFGTDAPTVQSSDAASTTVTESARFTKDIPPEWVAGQSLTLRVYAGMLTTVSDNSATLDAEIYVHDGVGGVGSDICATAVTNINADLVLDAHDFTITPTTVVNGDKLDIKLTIAITDDAAVTVVKGEIGAIQLLCDIKG